MKKDIYLKFFFRLFVFSFFFNIVYFQLFFNWKSFQVLAINNDFDFSKIEILKEYNWSGVAGENLRAYIKFKNNSNKDFKGFVYLECNEKSFGKDESISLAKNGDTDTLFFDGIISESGKINCFVFLKNEDLKKVYSFSIPLIFNLEKNNSLENLLAASSSVQTNINNALIQDKNINLINNSSNSLENKPSSNNMFQDIIEQVKIFFKENYFFNKANDINQNLNENTNPASSSTSILEKISSTSKKNEEVKENIKNLPNSLKSGVFEKVNDQDGDGILDALEKKYYLNKNNPNTFLIPDNISIYIIKYWYVILVVLIVLIVFLN